MNWLYVGFVGGVGTLALLFISGSITWQVYGQWAQGMPITGGWSWPLVLLVDLVCVLGMVALYLKIRWDSQTRIGRDSITRPGLFGVHTILWREVTAVEVFGGAGYHVIAGDKKIVVTPYAYKRPTDVIEMLRVRIEKARNAN